jgi:hypothetical protein
MQHHVRTTANMPHCTTPNHILEVLEGYVNNTVLKRSEVSGMRHKTMGGHIQDATTCRRQNESAYSKTDNVLTNQGK